MVIFALVGVFFQQAVVIFALVGVFFQQGLQFVVLRLGTVVGAFFLQ